MEPHPPPRRQKASALRASLPSGPAQGCSRQRSLSLTPAPRRHFQHGYGMNQFVDDFFNALALHLGLGADDQPMSENAARDGVDVLMRKVMPAVKQGPGASAAQQTERCPRTGAQRQIGMIAARLGQI